MGPCKSVFILLNTQIFPETCIFNKITIRLALSLLGMCEFFGDAVKRLLSASVWISLDSYKGLSREGLGEGAT